MEQMQFERQMERLYSCFNKSQSEKQINDWYRDFKFYSEKALEHAVDYIRKHEQYFPSFSTVMALVKQYTPLREKTHIECKYCDAGLILTEKHTFRCPACKQSDYRALPYYRGDIYSLKKGFLGGDIATVIWTTGPKITSDVL
jgi:hypothetical protein